ncbi:Aldo/keto reductase [Aureobasidium subglaciale]|nr:Aldo/keto reductase [Aureobasidium subglaciale]KAI5228526.1 Aldo/keto reductase [Aureobasidium subglaciale]KAI5231892.1 Aldo/keto reductase [Aureobasidium subglaciale]KAI5265876.1 Aldo/keto reductase [Aureobasidium subglaciale]
MSAQLTLESKLPLPSSDVRIPVLGLGVCVSSRCEQSVLSALEKGYRSVDTAQIYYNERETGTAVNKFLSQNPSIKRSDIFVCSKLWEVDLSRSDMPTSFDELCNSGPWPLNSLEAGHTTYSREGALAGIRKSLETSGLDYFDLYLLHNPRPGAAARHEAWLGLQEAFKSGKAKAIGVSNWSPQHIDNLMAHSDVDILPAVNQIEFHPWNQQRVILDYCRSKGIVGKRLGDPVIKKISEKHDKTAAQVVLRWCLQMGISIIPKSDRDARIAENADLFGWSLHDEDMAQIETLDEGQKGNIGEWDPFAYE